MQKVAILIVNYNMPERTDALVQHINNRVKWPYRLFVIDNGSDLVGPSQYTNVHILDNRQTTRGWLAGLEAADSYHEDYLAYWFLITSAEFPPGDADPLSPMAQLLTDDINAVGVHPALTQNSTTAWDHLKARGGDQPRRTWMIDNIASLYRATWFDGIGRFDPALIYGWGIDVETCWIARSQKRSLWVHEGSRIKKETDIGYKMDRMGMSAEARRRAAGQNMANVLSERYGANWWGRMMNDYVRDEWR